MSKYIYPIEIFYIIEGHRLIYKFENEENTVEKIEKNSWIGLISLLNSPIEDVIAVSKLKLFQFR